MDIHKPKPWHNIREFLKEYAIIVLGVLTALSAEQVAEGLRENKSAREAREAIREELAVDISDELTRRQGSQPCIDHRLEEIGAYLAAATDGKAPAPPNWIGRPPITLAFSGQWQASTQSGRVSLLPRQEAADYADVHLRVQQLLDHQNEEQHSWAELRTLQRLPKLTPEAIRQFQTALSQARYDSWRIQLDMLRIREGGLKQGLKADPAFLPQGDQPKARSTCIPITTPPDKALAMIGSSYGDPN